MHPLRTVLLLLCVPLFCGCAMSWQPVWQDAGLPSPTQESEALLTEAQQIFDQATEQQQLLAAQTAYQQVLKQDPANYQALKQLSTLHILLGTAFTSQRTQKSAHFKQAMRYAELAMYTNPEFRNKVDLGLPPWEAIDTLTTEEAEAMFFWVTAVQYEFKEGMSLPGKIINVSWLQRALRFLDRIETVAPEFGGGSVDFAKAICYYALPKAMGGSKDLGDASMQQAILDGEHWLLPRWARGKYYYPILGEEDKARNDLLWVANQPLDNFQDPYPWRVHFQQDARQLLR